MSSRFQSRTTPSRPAAASSDRAGLNATAMIRPCVPDSVTGSSARGWPTSHTFTVPSQLALARSVSSGLNATAATAST